MHTLTILSTPAYLEADQYDIIHDHSGPVAACLGAVSDTPVLHTLHGPFTPNARRLFRTIADRIYLNSISEYQRSRCPELNYVGTIHNAIHVAREAGVPLRMAGKLDPGADTRYFEEKIQPHIDGESVIFEGEVGSEKKRELLARARFLLFPIEWEEPFGLVMTEALACGTPVVATAMGAAPEMVEDGEVGVLVEPDAWDEMIAAIKDGRVDDIDRSRCRDSVEKRFSVEAMLDGYEAAFEKILASRNGATKTQGPRMESLRPR